MSVVVNSNPLIVKFNDTFDNRYYKPRMVIGGEYEVIKENHTTYLIKNGIVYDDYPLSHSVQGFECVEKHRFTIINSKDE